MNVDGELDHVVGRYALALILRMGLAGVGQVEGGVELLGGHRRVGWVDNYKVVAHSLEDAVGMHHVGLLLDVAEVLGLGPLVA